ncbi:hypothetical protein BDP27DRAFT_1433871 [Rhodocollybia butyracea]|uniref:Acetyl-CoA synthetase-like protein n=1 Tax=Rhodocollybia butyracea TaxID=206335 RepID=A0A9P5P8T0_9AGAR|nr:hypothetical protein BDP27DRAFT_1433871 [Rhodocollybia butyracea]
MRRITRITLFFQYETSDGSVNIPFADLAAAIHQATKYVALLKPSRIQDTPKHSPVAILANTGLNLSNLESSLLLIDKHTDIPTYFSVVLGLMSAKIPCFPISTRNSPPAIAHLLRSVGVTRILVGNGADTHSLVEQSLRELQLLSTNSLLHIFDMPTYEELFIHNREDFCTSSCVQVDTYNSRTPVIYVHSSGSLSAPKPIPWCHESLLQVSMVPYMGQWEFHGEIFSAHAVPMYHASGLNFIPWVVFTLAIFPPQKGFIVPTPENVIQGIEMSHAVYLICVPSFIEVGILTPLKLALYLPTVKAWAQDMRALKTLQNLKALAYGGGTLPEAVGNHIIGQGIKLLTVFGSTEAGVISDLFPAFQGIDWKYFSINPHCAANFIDQGDGTYELIVMEEPTHFLPVVNTIHNGHSAYCTGDLFMPHPQKKGYWTSFGRADDRITLSTGLKLNPGPFEAILNSSSFIEAALLFGTGQSQPGLLVFPASSKDLNIDTNTVIGHHLFIERIWEDILKTVIIASKDIPIARTNKGSVQRAATLGNYQNQCDNLFRRIQYRVPAGVPKPTIWTKDTILDYIQAVVQAILPSVQHDDDNLPLHGCTSLQASWIRKSMLDAFYSAMSSNDENIPTLPFNLVYQYPSISALTQYLLSRVDVANTLENFNGNDWVDSLISQPFHPQEVTRVIQKTHFPDIEYNLFGETFLITGSMGFLGANVLAHLVCLEAVQHVYVLARPSGGLSLQARQKNVLQKQGLSTDIAESPKIVYIEGKLDENGLNVTPDLKRKVNFYVGLPNANCLSDLITTSYKKGWPVNFNADLSFFRPSLHGLRALIELSINTRLRQPPRLVFIGSLGAFCGLEVLKETLVNDSRFVSDSGYAKSKWLAETILTAATRTTEFSPVIIRLGQLCGSFGIWKVAEWFPALVKSSVKIGFLPRIESSVSWIPVNTAAKAIVEMRNSSTTVLHVAHPRPTPLVDILEDIASILQIPLGSFQDWIRVLMDIQMDIDQGTVSLETMDAVPALGLLGFFCSLHSHGLTKLDAIGTASCEKAINISETLGTATSLTKEDIRCWIGNWKECGFL